MPKFIKFPIVVNVFLWALWIYLLLGTSPGSYKPIFLFLGVLFLALGLTLSFPFYFIYHKKLSNFTNLKLLYRRGLKWGMFISFGVAGFGFLRALNLVNLLNAGLFGLLYLGIFIQLRGWR